MKKRLAFLLPIFFMANMAAGAAVEEAPLSLSAKAPTVGPVGGQPAKGSKQSVKDYLNKA